jgi:hypothetical protein
MRNVARLLRVELAQLRLEFRLRGFRGGPLCKQLLAPCDALRDQHARLMRVGPRLLDPVRRHVIRNRFESRELAAGLVHKLTVLRDLLVDRTQLGATALLR